MGDRASIYVISESLPTNVMVELYGHWAGTTNARAVASVLEKTDRLGDVSYLTAQVFYEFAIIKGDYTGYLGYGINVVPTLAGSSWNDNPDIILNADNGSVIYDGTTYTKEQFIQLVETLQLD